MKPARVFLKSGLLVEFEILAFAVWPDMLTTLCVLRVFIKFYVLFDCPNLEINLLQILLIAYCSVTGSILKYFPNFRLQENFQIKVQTYQRYILFKT